MIPIVGFFVLPWTTIAYAVCRARSSDRAFGVEWVVVAIAFGLDVILDGLEGLRDDAGHG